MSILNTIYKYLSTMHCMKNRLAHSLQNSVLRSNILIKILLSQAVKLEVNMVLQGTCDHVLPTQLVTCISVASATQNETPLLL